MTHGKLQRLAIIEVQEAHDQIHIGSSIHSSKPSFNTWPPSPPVSTNLQILSTRMPLSMGLWIENLAHHKPSPTLTATIKRSQADPTQSKPLQSTARSTTFVRCASSDLSSLSTLPQQERLRSTHNNCHDHTNLPMTTAECTAPQLRSCFQEIDRGE